MHWRAFGISDKGSVRRRNEDAFFADGDAGLFAVADGLGGLPGGAEASALAVSALAAALRREDVPGIAEMRDVIHEVDGVIVKKGQEIDPVIGIGTTLTLVQLLPKSFILGHVGDSAAYLLRRGVMHKLTTDHTMEQQLIAALGPSARENMPVDYPHTLTSCIGQEGLTPDCERHETEPGDRLLLCTDGLSKVVPEKQLAVILGHSKNPEAICRAMVRAALDARGPDNITAVAVLID
jgi:protein phosphatase